MIKSRFDNESRNTVKRIIDISKLYLPFVLLAAGLAVVYAWLSRRIPVIVGDGVDLIFDNGTNVDLAELGIMLGKIPLLLLFASLADYLMRVSGSYAGVRVTAKLRRDCMKKINKLPLSYLDSHPTGDILSRLVSDTDLISDSLISGTVELFSSATCIVITLIFMFSMNVWVALTVAVLTPLSMALASFVAKKTFKLFKKSSVINAGGTSVVEESVGGLDVIRAFGHEKAVTDEYDGILKEYRKNASKAVFFSSLPNPTSRFLNSTVYALVALVGGLMVIYKPLTLSVGALVTLLAFAKDYAKPFNDLSGVLAEVQSALASASRVFEFLDSPEESPEPENPEAPNPEGCIELHDVSFSYTDSPFMEKLNLKVKPGQRIALVGPTGCGKTTLINLFLRFYEISDGSITLDGKDIRSFSRKDLRNTIGMVLQDTWISPGTVRENITLGKPDATDEEIHAAALKSHAHSFISRLPDGYDTVLGENGGRLSVGERQLLCITRLMLNPPPILILDEATSSIDTRTEMKIQDAFSELMKGRTSFIVAHRLNTIKNADLIIVMKNGKIIEIGSHSELIAKKSYYYDLFNAQYE